MNAVKAQGYEKPSPIQALALPILLAKPTDFIGLAATGTGKTAAFVIPMLEKIDAHKKQVQALILCPTRELANQVCEQVNLFGKTKKIRSVAIYGGAGYGDQIHGLKSGAQVVVGTPGRVIDHLERRTLNLSAVQTVILDEADEMISMGFKEDIEMVLDHTPKKNNKNQAKIWLFSATMSREVRRVADHYLTAPEQIQINQKEVLSDKVKQIFYPTQESNKPEVLCKLIDSADDFFGIVFCQTKALVVDLCHYLTDRGYKVDSLHGDKTQSDRERTLKAFRDRKVNILICTDVASRGIDVKDITHVINYSIPRELDSYVHRIGRTARSGKEGLAWSLVTPSHRGLIGRIEKLTKSKMVEGKIPSRKDLGVKKVNKILETFKNVQDHQRSLELLSDDWNKVIATMDKKEITGRFLTMMFPEIFVAAKPTTVSKSPVLKLKH